MGSKYIGIDMGASSTLMYLSGKEKIIEEPSVIAVSVADPSKILAAGSEATVLLGRIPGAVKLVYPFRNGVDVGTEQFEYFIKYILSKAEFKGPGKPVLLLCLSGEALGEREDEVYDIVRKCGVRDVAILGKLPAAAIGAGIECTRPGCNLIVDVGGSETVMAIISMGNPIKSAKLSVGGDALSAAIAGYLSEKCGLRINFEEAERIKLTLGGVWKRDRVLSDDAIGVNASDGLPNSVTITSRDVFGAISSPVKQIAVSIRKFIAALSESERFEIEENGIVLIGGGSRLYGLDKLLEGATGIHVRVAEDPVAAVALGFEKLSKSF